MKQIPVLLKPPNTKSNFNYDVGTVKQCIQVLQMRNNTESIEVKKCIEEIKKHFGIQL